MSSKMQDVKIPKSFKSTKTTKLKPKSKKQTKQKSKSKSPMKSKSKNKKTANKKTVNKNVTLEQSDSDVKSADNDDGLGETVLVRYTPQRDLTLSDFTNLSASHGFGNVMGYHPTVFLSANNVLPKLKAKTARDWWERASVAQQCDNTIGPFLEGTKCYICGFPIKQLPECEHILSVFKASMFLHLYRNDFKLGQDGVVNDSTGKPLDKRTIDRIMFELLLEYKWAHRCCNQVKSDIDFVKFNGRQFVFNDENATEILEGIARSMTSVERDICSDKYLKEYFNPLKGKEQKITEWIEERKRILSTPPNFNNPSTVSSYMVDNNGAVGAIISYLNGGVTLNRDWVIKADSSVRTKTSTRNYLMQMFGPNEYQIRFGRSLADPNIEQGLMVLQIISRAILAADMEAVNRVNSILGGVEYVPTPFPIPEKEVYTIATTLSEFATLLEESFKFDWGKSYNSRQIYTYFENILEYDSKKFANDFNPGRNIPKEKQNFYKTVLCIVKVIPKYGGIFSIMFAMMNKVLEFDKSSSSTFARLGLILILLLHYYNRVNTISKLNPELDPLYQTNPAASFTSALLIKLDRDIQMTYRNIYEEFANVHDEPDKSIVLFFNIIKQIIDPGLLESFIVKTNEIALIDLNDTNAKNNTDEYFKQLPNALDEYFVENAESSRVYNDFEMDYVGEPEEVREAKRFAFGVHGLLSLKDDPDQLFTRLKRLSALTKPSGLIGKNTENPQDKKYGGNKNHTRKIRE
jgi:hypothetical protein